MRDDLLRYIWKSDKRIDIILFQENIKPYIFFPEETGR